MKKLENILAATDLSPESLSGVRQAVEIAKDQGAFLTIVHVPAACTPPGPKPGGSTVIRVPQPPATVNAEAEGASIDLVALSLEMEEAARETLDRWMTRHAKNVRTHLVLRHGEAHEVICEVAAETRADLLVMTTHARKGLAHAIFGSVTEHVLRDAPCPVLVVKPRTRAAAKRNAA